MQMILRGKKGKFLTALVAVAMIFTTLGFSTDYAVAAAKKPTSITLKVTTQTIDVNGTAKVSVKSVKPSNAGKDVTYKSSNKKVATVTNSGTIKGIKPGTVTITATSKNAKKVTSKIKVKVENIKINTISLNKKEVTLSAGDAFTLKPVLKPAGVYNAGVTYDTNDAAIAMVNQEGVVTAKAPGNAKITVKAKENKKSVICKVKVIDADILNAWVMTGYYSNDKINNTAVAKKAKVQIWNNNSKKFVPCEKSAKRILGNYVQLYDSNKDNVADLIQIVKYKDGESFWNAETTWVDGAGDTGEESCLTDDVGETMFAEKYRIPMGERLLSTYGLGAWSGTTDFNNYEDSPYWENTDYDFYNLKSDDTLTMLNGYKSALQTTSSTCVMTSAMSVLEWYGVRGDLNERDLSSLRGESRAGKVGGTSLTEAKQVFNKLSELGITGKWNMKSWDDDEYGLYDSEWIQSELAKGHPIIVIWNSFGAHGQVIIGYDNMGTDVTNDDVLIMMDPYDTTDHNADGYIIQSYERLAYGLLTWSDAGTTGTKYLSVWPDNWNYKNKKGTGMANDSGNTSIFSDEGKIPYGNTAADLAKYYPDTEYIINGLAGAASVERSGDYNESPYFNIKDFYGTEKEIRKAIGSDTLKLLNNFQTIQQATEWTCGTTSALMTINWFDKNQARKADRFGEGNLETDVSLAAIRQIDKVTNIGATGATYRDGMKEVFDYMNNEYDQDWKYFTNMDLDDPEGEESYIGEYCLQAGSETAGWDGLIPYLIDNDIPMMIGSDEWGGHWQVIVGYDSMGTEGTQDDVLILADAYDTTDQNQNGYCIKSFERLVYGWGAAFEDGYNDFIVAFPAAGNADVIKTLGLN